MKSIFPEDFGFQFEIVAMPDFVQPCYGLFTNQFARKNDKSRIITNLLLHTMCKSDQIFTLGFAIKLRVKQRPTTNFLLFNVYACGSFSTTSVQPVNGCLKYDFLKVLSNQESDVLRATESPRFRR